MTVEVKTYRRGTLAYYDTFAGLVPCKVMEVLDDNKVKIKVTVAHGAYKRGETIFGVGTNWVVPRPHVVQRSGQYKIVGGWQYLD